MSHGDKAISALLDPSPWQPIEKAPRNERIIVWTGQEIYAAHWAKNPWTGDEAWIICEYGDYGDQLLCRPLLWQPAPAKPHVHETQT